MTGSGKTFLAAFDVLNFNPRRLLYIVHEGSILMKSVETFEKVFGADKIYGVYNADYKEFDAGLVFSILHISKNRLEYNSMSKYNYSCLQNWLQGFSVLSVKKNLEDNQHDVLDTMVC